MKKTVLLRVSPNLRDEFNYLKILKKKSLFELSEELTETLKRDRKKKFNDFLGGKIYE